MQFGVYCLVHYLSTKGISMSTMSAPLSYSSHYRTLIKLALPVMFSQAGHLIVQITDNMMVGRIGTTSLAASSFGHNVFIGGLLFCIGFSAAMTPLVGAARGKGDVQEAAEWFKNGFIANMMLTGAIIVLMLIVGLFLDNMGQIPEVVRLARPFYFLMIASIAPVMVFQSFKQFAEGLGNTRAAAFITVIEIVINVGLNYVLIFGKFGFPQLGIVGSGIATFVARCSMMISFALIAWKTDFFAEYRVAFAKARVDPAKIRQFFTFGLPLGGQSILEVGAFALGAIMMGWLGAAELASHQIAISVAALTFMGAMGIAAAGTIQVSQYRGAGDWRNLRQAGFATLHIVLAYETCTAIVFIIARHWIPTLYVNDTAVITMAANLLIIAALFQLFDGAQVVLLWALRGIADAKVPMIIAFVSYILIALPTSYTAAFVLQWREMGIWTGYLLGLGVASTFFFVRFFVRSKGA